MTMTVKALVVLLWIFHFVVYDVVEASDDDSSSKCDKDISFQSKAGKTDYPAVPIEIIEQKTFTVTFKVINPFDTPMKTMYTQYNQAQLQTTCLEFQDVLPETDPNITQYFESDRVFSAHCMTRKPATMVDVFFSDCNSDLKGGATIPTSCPQGDDVNACPIVKYTFVVMCASQCEEGARQRLLVDAGEDDHDERLNQQRRLLRSGS